MSYCRLSVLHRAAWVPSPFFWILGLPMNNPFPPSWGRFFRHVVLLKLHQHDERTRACQWLLYDQYLEQQKPDLCPRTAPPHIHTTIIRKVSDEISKSGRRAASTIA